MPPLKGIDRGLNGEALKALEESGHGQRIAIVDPSYAIPEDAPVVNYQGDSSATALRGILALVPTEKLHDRYDVILMRADSEQWRDCEATNAFEEVTQEMELKIGYKARVSDPHPGGPGPRVGFYDHVNSPDTLFFRTRDTKAYACATFIVGHSQDLESTPDTPVPEAKEPERDETKYAVFTEMRSFMEQIPEYTNGQVLGHLWSRLMKETGVGSEEIPRKKQGLIDVKGELLEIIRIGEDYSSTWRPYMIDQTLGLSMNLETLQKMLDAKELRKIVYLGTKAESFVREFLAARQDESKPK